MKIPYYNEKQKRHIFFSGQKIYIGKDTSLRRDDFMHIDHNSLMDKNNQAGTLWIIGDKEEIPNVGDLIEMFRILKDYVFLVTLFHSKK